jgi:predicted site-specific integrase-resolvase
MDSRTTSAAGYLRPKDVKARFRISEATIYRWIRAKKVEAIHKDGITLILVASLEAYLATWKRR